MINAIIPALRSPLIVRLCWDIRRARHLLIHAESLTYQNHTQICMHNSVPCALTTIRLLFVLFAAASWMQVSLTIHTNNNPLVISFFSIRNADVLCRRQRRVYKACFEVWWRSGNVLFGARMRWIDNARYESGIRAEYIR